MGCCGTTVIPAKAGIQRRGAPPLRFAKGARASAAMRAGDARGGVGGMQVFDLGKGAGPRPLAARLPSP